MPLTKLNFTGSGQGALISVLPTGSVLQTIQGTSDSKYTLDSADTWENTGFVSLTFPNALQSNSKVLVRINVLLGEAQDNGWASRTAVTIFENSTNKGHATYGIVSSSAHDNGSANTQYKAESMSGELLFTPSVTNGTYALYCKAPSSYVRTIGGASINSSNTPIGNTQVTLQEIKG
tara:strand:- start:61 stop:591 length:531 start_codon:yes stop_codon:yes gene_type:complete